MWYNLKYFSFWLSAVIYFFFPLFPYFSFFNVYMDTKLCGLDSNFHVNKVAMIHMLVFKVYFLVDFHLSISFIISISFRVSLKLFG